MNPIMLRKQPNWPTAPWRPMAMITTFIFRFNSRSKGLATRRHRRNSQNRFVTVLERKLETVPEDARAHVLLASSMQRSAGPTKPSRKSKKRWPCAANDALMLYNAACTYGNLNMKAEAMATLKKAANAGYINPEWAARDNDLAFLHDDPEFQRLINTPRPKT